MGSLLVKSKGFALINAFAFIKVREHSKTVFEWRRTHIINFFVIKKLKTSIILLIFLL